MELLRSAKAVVINAPVAAQVDTATYAGQVWIKGLIPFKHSNYVGYTVKTPAAEVQQVLTVAALAAVATNTKYQIKVGNVLDRQFENVNQLKPYTAVTPAIGGINANVDNYNLQTRLASRINSDTGANYFAGAQVQIAFASTTVAPVSPGLNRPVWVKGSLSGSVAFIYFTAAGVSSIGQGAITTANLNIWNGVLPITNDVFTAINSPIDGSLGTLTANFPVVTATPITTALGKGLIIVDNSGYYNAFGNRHGISGYQVSAGFQPSDMSVTVVGAVSYGQGPRMLQNVPVKEVSSDNLARGDWNFPSASNNPVSDPVSSSVVTSLTAGTGGYAEITIFSKEYTKVAGSGQQLSKQIQQNIYVPVTDAQLNIGGNYAAFLAAIAAL